MIKGTAYKFGDNVDTDQIISAKYLVTTDAKELAKHCMEIADPDFPTEGQAGGYPRGRTQFWLRLEAANMRRFPLKGMELGLVIAESFARIFTSATALLSACRSWNARMPRGKLTPKRSARSGFGPRRH